MEEVHCKLTDKIKEDVRSLWESKLFSDIIVRLNGKEFQAHRVILFTNSPMFRNMLTCETKEKYEQVIELKCDTVYIDEDSFAILLEYMYTNSMKLNSSNVLGVLRMADYLAMEEPKQSCFLFLSKVINSKNVLALYKVAYYYNKNELLYMAVPIIWQHFEELEQGLLELDYKEFSSALAASIPNHSRNEEIVCSAALSWVKHNPQLRLLHLASLMANVELDKIQSSFLCETLRKERIIRSDDPCFNQFMEAIRPRVNETEPSDEDSTGLLKSEAIITFSIKNNLQEMQYNSSELSPAVFVRGVPWQLKIEKTRSSRIRMCLQCCYDDNESKWSFDVSIQCRVISYEKGTTNQEYDLSFRFDAYNKCGGSCDVIDLNSSYSSYVAPENTMTFQIYFKVDPVRTR